MQRYNFIFKYTNFFVKSFVFLNESTYLGNDIHVDTYYLLALTGRNLINLLCYAYASFFLALRDKLPPFRRNWLATMNSLGSLRLPPYIYSPVRFTPVIGVMSGAHYRTLYNVLHLSPKIRNFRGS